MKRFASYIFARAIFLLTANIIVRTTVDYPVLCDSSCHHSDMLTSSSGILSVSGSSSRRPSTCLLCCGQLRAHFFKLRFRFGMHPLCEGAPTHSPGHAPKQREVMADWLLLVRAVALVSLPCLLLIYTFLLGAPPQPPGEPDTSAGTFNNNLINYYYKYVNKHTCPTSTGRAGK